MSKENGEGIDDLPQSAGGRDERGRYIAGCSGNRGGRPRKENKHSRSLAEALASALGEQVEISSRGGAKEVVSVLDLIARTIARSSLKGSPKDMLAFLQAADKHGAIQLLAAEREGEAPSPYLSEEDRRMIEAIEKGLSAQA